jgi:hypothetical protein
MCGIFAVFIKKSKQWLFNGEGERNRGVLYDFVD